MMGFWEFIDNKLSASVNLILLYVLESEGSSPGRKGFKMAVAADGDFTGTIGGGIMEYKLVEKARAMLQQNDAGVLLVRQFHDKQHPTNRSGMICSGSQLNAFIPLMGNDSISIKKIIAEQQNREWVLQVSPHGLTISNAAATGLQYNSDEDWCYAEALNQQPVIHIIGGGHVGLALSELMHWLNFYVKLYDDRPELNTLNANVFADEKIIVNYEEISGHFANTHNDYVVIMTIGYRTDKIIVKQLIDLPFFYLGLLGSAHKIATLFEEMKAEGCPEAALKNIHAPIGIDISSKTTKEIAVSIAAELIRKKNVE